MTRSRHIRRHHDHGHDHHHGRRHGHDHEHHHGRAGGRMLVIRPNSGISGDIMVAGLLALADCGEEGLNGLLRKLRLDHLVGRVALEKREHDNIGGFGLKVDLPEEHEHRRLADVEKFFDDSELAPAGRDLAMAAFRLIAEAEGQVHGLPPEEVHFHEVGALDSLMDIGLAAALWEELAPEAVRVGPLPICDGEIRCQHGLLSAPAPAVMKLLAGVPVRGLASRGETVTPTGLALLKAMKASFGPWPEMVVERQALVYGGRILPDVPNGAVFALGRRLDRAVISGA